MGNAYELRKIQNRIFKRTNQFGGHLFRDDDWSNVSKMAAIIKDTDGVTDMDVWAGEYHNYINKANPGDPAYRDYKIIVYTDFGKLGGYIRCNAAGTVEDEFAYYDMTVSVYPMKDDDIYESKKMIITRSQLRQLNEIMDSNKTDVKFTGSNAAEMGANAEQANKNALATGLKQDSILLNGKTNNNNNNNSATITFDSSNGSNIKASVTDAVQDAVNNGADINDINVVGSPKMTEDKKYSKRQLEEARLYNMRKNGVVMTKKELNESFPSSMGPSRRELYLNVKGAKDYVDIYLSQNPSNALFAELQQKMEEAAEIAARIAKGK